MLARTLKTWPLWPALLLLAIFLAWPSVDVLTKSLFDPEFTTVHYVKALDGGVYTQVLLQTLWVSLLTAVLGTALAYPAAYYIASKPSQSQFLLLFLVLVPLWTSVLVRSFAWMTVLGREGLVNATFMWLSFTDAPVKMLYTTGAVYVAMIQILLPVQIVTIYGAMTEIDRDLLRAARVLGATPTQAWRRIYLPLSFDGVMAAVSLSFMLAMGFFITPALVGSRKDMMIANLIDFQVQRLNWGFASALALTLLAVTLAAVVILRFVGSSIRRRLA